MIKNKLMCLLSKIILKTVEILDGNETQKDSLPTKLTADEYILNMRPSHLFMLNEVFRLIKIYCPITDASFYLKTLKIPLLFKSIQEVRKK